MADKAEGQWQFLSHVRGGNHKAEDFTQKGHLEIAPPHLSQIVLDSMPCSSLSLAFLA